MSDNLAIYNAVRQPPPEAIKPILGGRQKGKSDINPMWRIKALTEQFGPVGIGWKYVILKKWIEEGANGEKSAFVDIDLYYKHEGAWSEAIPGTGGNSFIAKESGGLYTNDECFKMALTDAISVACKALGFAADIYWNSDSTKYNKPENKPPNIMDNHNHNHTTSPNPKCADCGNTITAGIKKVSEQKFGKSLCMICQKKQQVGA